MQTVVADTSALVSVAIPGAVETYDPTSDPDPLQYLLTSCTVTVPTAVKQELEQMAQYNDLHGTAAGNVLAASGHYTTEDPLAMSETPDTLPAWGLDDGETACLLLANTRGVDGFLTDEFAGTSFTLIHARLAEARILTTPRFLRDLAYAGHLSPAEAKRLLTTIERHRSWEENAYVQNVKRLLD